MSSAEIIDEEARDPSDGPIVVVGYGNALRGDDGVGVMAAELIAALKLSDVEVETGVQLLPELAAAVAKAKAVVFIDATVAGTNCVLMRALPRAVFSDWTDHLGGPAALLALTQAVFGVCPRAWTLEIPAEEMGWKVGVSAGARAKVREAVGAFCLLREELLKERRILTSPIGHA